MFAIIDNSGYNSPMNKLLVNKKAFIFDMDGVLVDSEALYVKIEQDICRNHGIDIPASEWDHFKGKTNQAIFSYILSNFAATSSLNVDDLIEEKRQLVKSSLQQTPLFAGAIDFLQFIRARFPLVALTTSSSKGIQELIFSIHNLESYFDIVVTGDQVSQGKPNPEPYIVTMQKLGVTPVEAMVLEDSDNGILSAKAAGCLAIGITNSFSAAVLQQAGADFIVDNFKQLHQELE